jgi:hypothetical protein
MIHTEDLNAESFIEIVHDNSGNAIYVVTNKVHKESSILKSLNDVIGLVLGYEIKNIIVCRESLLAGLYDSLKEYTFEEAVEYLQNN